MDNGDFKCEICGWILEHEPDDYNSLYCPACKMSETADNVTIYEYVETTG